MVVILRLNYQIFLRYSECGCSMNLCDGILINFVLRALLLTGHNTFIFVGMALISKKSTVPPWYHLKAANLEPVIVSA